MCQLKLTFCLCDICGQLRYRAAAKNGSARPASCRHSGETAETERKSSIGQSGGGYDERDEESTTAGVVHADGVPGADLVANLLRLRRKTRANIARARPPL
jgi:hypothetical protein